MLYPNKCDIRTMKELPGHRHRGDKRKYKYFVSISLAMNILITGGTGFTPVPASVKFDNIFEYTNFSNRRLR